MTRKLVLLNLLLVALLGAAAWQLRENWLAARAREQALARKKVPPEPAPVVPAAAPVPPVQAATYLDVAQNMLFSKDRNPNVVIEVAPPKPVPAFPEAHGVMDLGAGPTIILSEKAGGPQKSYRNGDKVGPFQIARLTTSEVVLAWEDKEFPKKIEELKPKATAVQAPAELATGNRPPQPQPVRGTFYPPTPPEKALEAQDALRPKDGSPGLDVGGTARVCVPGDTTPAGTVMGGYRKVVSQSPFGRSCRWEPIR
jgi:hypothetical protein